VTTAIPDSKTTGPNQSISVTIGKPHCSRLGNPLDQGGGKRRTVVATKSHQNVINECSGDASDQEAKDDGEYRYINGPPSDFCHLGPPNYWGSRQLALLRVLL
jgi:hypothetical protein